MILIGLTGGIGSGKSKVADVFRTLGIPVFESDTIAKSIMETDQLVRNKIIEVLGPQAYTASDQLDRKWIASQVFSDEHKLEQLNAVVHPAVHSALLAWSKEETQRSAPYLIQESAILFEENLTDRFKAIILVVADEEIRISRVMERDNAAREKVMKRIQHQWSDKKKITLSDYIIFNDAERSLITQVTDIDKMIRSTEIQIC